MGKQKEQKEEYEICRLDLSKICPWVFHSSSPLRCLWGQFEARLRLLQDKESTE